MKVLILGSGDSPTGRYGRLYASLSMLEGISVGYKKMDDIVVGNEPSMTFIDEFRIHDLSKLEEPFSNALLYGVSHPEMFDLPPADKRKEPKGPRGRWGKLK